MRWKIVLAGRDEFGSAHRSELTIDKDLERVSAGEIGFSVEDGKAIMAHLQQVVVNQQCEGYVLTSRAWIARGSDGSRTTASARSGRGFVTPTVAGVSFVSKMADGDIVRSPPIPT
jgi:hypothetical protein